LHRNGGGEAFDLGLRQVDHHLFHLLEARQLLELELVQQAAKRRRIEDLLPVREALHAMNAIHESHRRPEFAEHDLRFHLAIARVAGNPVLASMLQSLLGSLRPCLNQLPVETDCRERTARSHFEIFRALVDGDAAEARDRMHDHLRLAYDNLLGEVQSLPGESAARAV
jgi:GntR family transcriptional repressor for pyruvate dehydrogenase complex